MKTATSDSKDTEPRYLSKKPRERSVALDRDVPESIGFIPDLMKGTVGARKLGRQ